MAALTTNLTLRNDGKLITTTPGAATQTILYDRSDEKFVIHVTNGDALDCRIKVLSLGNGDGDSPDLDVDIAASETFVIGALESMTYKDAATQSVTLEILDQDNSAFSGTVTNVVFTLIELPKALTN